MNINGSDLQGEDYLNPSVNISKQQEGNLCIKQKNGHWDDNEHSIYLEFLSNARGDSYKKGQPLFKKMSEFIGTRSPSQCRSHHQKFNPQNFETKNSKKKYFKNRIKDSRQPILRSKQIMRKYFALNRETTDEE
ncbi:unnamed protein product (macronuclear) [Paramecium tetraurelia]|uniref:Myb-like domain-containing protein n=1 Tax=Paramecium tetraurelia TaxID=5888 RepID=A0C4V8_PARTE|nr:uncharacterized protein GSPATT00006324001 [Paramecium tetraurelia]CAK65825.1 unnamed protein product [Paramecium tetraurelia]|eukprot:XP_001433222.1 hypothetical protein (macronuclear) [Paramecium tetraurelia strain d4-2]